MEGAGVGGGRKVEGSMGGCNAGDFLSRTDQRRVEDGRQLETMTVEGGI